MKQEDLLLYKANVYSQAGEDGIVAAIFDRIGFESKVCLEVGAWDGMHLSNCRKLILDGWRAVLIEGDPNRFNDLVSNYKANPLVICVNRFIDDGENRLDRILEEHEISSLDFISVDIDGLDYEIFETLETRPRVICIEVIVGNDPRLTTRTPRDVAKNMVGQSLQMFVRLADQKGYGLVCYTFNAFFVRDDIIKKFSLPVLSAEEAYVRCLNHLDSSTREWLYLYNLGIAPPFRHKFNNPYLTRAALGITTGRARQLLWRARCRALAQFLKNRSWSALSRFRAPLRHILPLPTLAF